MAPISARWTFASANTFSIMPNACVLRPPVSTASASTTPSRATATLRCSEENSSAKRVIDDFSFRFTGNFNGYIFQPGQPGRALAAAEGPFGPFNHGDAVRRQIILDARR